MTGAWIVRLEIRSRAAIGTFRWADYIVLADNAAMAVRYALDDAHSGLLPAAERETQTELLPQETRGAFVNYLSSWKEYEKAQSNG